MEEVLAAETEDPEKPEECASRLSSIIGLKQRQMKSVLIGIKHTYLCSIYTFFNLQVLSYI
jgi:hypothetical protein